MTDIVVGIDGSPSAAEALRWAVREGSLRERRVTAVLAWGLLDQHHPDPDQAFDPSYDRHDARRALQAYVESALDPAAAAQVHLRPLNDLAPRALLEASTDAELLVLGGRGLGGFGGLLIGSVSYQCLHHATCPVAIVRDHADAQPHAAGRIVVGIDGSATSLRALHWAVTEARLRGASLDVLHAWQMNYGGGVAFGVPAVDPTLFEKPAQATLDEAMAGLDLTGLAHPVRPTLVCGGPASSLLEAASGADLIVMGTRGRGGFTGLLLGSATSQVVHHATCPVVVIPPAA